MKWMKNRKWKERKNTIEQHMRREENGDSVENSFGPKIEENGGGIVPTLMASTK